MKLPISWLKEYVDVNVTPEELVELLMWRGFEVAEILDEMPGISGVVVGRITSITKHENADKLSVCMVDIGDRTVQIITAATNVFEGALVPASLDGAKLAGGMEIHDTVMRGVLSQGMFCSGKELGIDDGDYPGASVNGILILGDEVRPGQRIQDALNMTDKILDIELTPNRADCQSIIGMCRETAAALGQKIKEPVIRHIEGSGNAADYATVTVENTELCPRYTARVVKDLVIEPSPKWMQHKLKLVGMRPINNIVDITNLVLVEYGHPMHAFDLACINGSHIIVRNAHKDEIVTTLDKKERPVTEDMLLIADEQRGVGIAGVMGGLNSEITEETKATLFESAVFKGSNIRATTRKLRHVTDAAARFIKGVEPVNAYLAIERAIELVDELHAGSIVGGMIDACGCDTCDRVVEIDPAHVCRIINTEIAPEKMAEMLGTISIDAKVAGDKLIVTIPHWRVDIESGIEADWDIAEEVARIYGYYNIKPTLMTGDTFRGGLSAEARFDDRLTDACASQGCFEMYNFNFTGPAKLDALNLPEGDEKRQAVRLLNPFGEDQSLMRTTLYIGMLDSLSLNINRKTGQGRFFELANVHFDNNDDLPEERHMLGLVFDGESENFFTMKGAIETVLEAVDCDGAEITAGGGEYFQPGQKAVITLNGEVIGEMGAVHPLVQKAFDIPRKCYMAELNAKRLLALSKDDRHYSALPRYPSVSRDIAIVVSDACTSASLVKCMETVDTGLILSDVQLFDVYRGKGVPDGKKSMAYTFTLRAADRTLNDDDITSAVNKLLTALGDSFGAVLRA